MTSRVVSLSSGDRVEVLVDALVAPMAPRRPDGSSAAGSLLRASYRVSVVVPTVSNPPLRVPFGEERFAEFELALAGWSRGWSLRPGLTLGLWLSPEMGWVRDESRVYEVVVPSLAAVEALTTKLYAHVKDRFDQTEVLVSVTPEYSTLFSASAAGDRDEAHAA
jgi:hypothetical protein